jgi:uncharacterized protein YlxP (DUF503 family)
MVIGLVTATVSIPEAQSLKDKRSVLRSLKDRVAGRMNVSVAEVGKQDLVETTEFGRRGSFKQSLRTWQRAR